MTPQPPQPPPEVRLFVVLKPCPVCNDTEAIAFIRKHPALVIELFTEEAPQPGHPCPGPFYRATDRTLEKISKLLRRPAPGRIVCARNGKWVEL